MVSVGVSCMDKTSVVFVEPGAKVNSHYYCEVLGQGYSQMSTVQARWGHYN